MSDPLTPNLPEGWKQWAFSPEVRLLGLGLVLLLNLWVSFRVLRCKHLDRKQKKLLLGLLWLLPVVMLPPVVHLLHQLNKGDGKAFRNGSQ